MFKKPLIKALAIAGIVGGLAGGTVYYQVKGVEIDETKLIIEPKPTILYDTNGQPFAQFHQEKKYMSTYDEIPESIVNALVSTEDKYFYDHSGVSVRGTTRALYAVIKAKGEFVQGGSTLTQQLAKQIYLHAGKDIDRKLEEWVIASVIEENFTKEEIVSMYLNHVFYGQRSYGVADAVETYFGESLEEFKENDRIDQIAKAALIAGLPQAPSAHNPYMDPDAAKVRRDTVIFNMMDQGYITEEEYEKAIKKPFLVLETPYTVHEDEIIHYPEYTHYVLSEMAKELNLNSVEEAMVSGLKVYTSFDPQVYKVLRENFKRDELFPQNASDGVKVQGAGVIINPQNGEIYAMTGSREQITSDQFLMTTNRAFQMKRQPGSTFKPVISYGPALESGKFHPWSLVMSANGSCFDGYCVKGGSSSSWATMEIALQNSWNVSSVWLLDKVGIKNAREYAEKLGITLGERDVYLPIALGGLDTGVSPLEMADSYQAYANEGKRSPAHAIRRMVAHNGDIVFEAPVPEQVIKPQTAEYMKYMLRNVVTKGTGRNANTSPDNYVAGKTGTVELPIPGLSQYNKDIWFVGFTKDYVGAIWMGFDNTDATHYLNAWSGVPAKMFGEIIKPLVEIRPDPVKDYTSPTVIKPEVDEFNLSGKTDEKTRSVTLSWEEKEDTYYKVFRDGEEMAEITKTSFTDEKLEYDKEYAYVVKAYNKFSDFETHQTNEFLILFKSPVKETEEKPKETEIPPVEEEGQPEKNQEPAGEKTETETTP